MKTDWDPRHLDVRAFARAHAVLQGTAALAEWPRLSDDAAQVQGEVHWRLGGQWRAPAGGEEQPWLSLQAEVCIPLVCQRCLAPVACDVAVDRAFRFVADEAQAELQDEQSEEDVLVWSHSFDALALVEDELIMALPMVPVHPVCPDLPTAMAPREEALAPERPNPFAALSALRKPKS